MDQPSQRKATLQAGKKKLDEFRRKKEAALAAKRDQKSHSTDNGTDAESDSRHTSHEREEFLESQIKELMGSVDQLHRSLNDERYNSSQLELQIEELRRKVVEGEAREAKAEGLLIEKEAEWRKEMETLQTLHNELQMQAQQSDSSQEKEHAVLKDRIFELEKSLTEAVQVAEEQTTALAQCRDDIEASFRDKVAMLEADNAELLKRIRSAEEKEQLLEGQLKESHEIQESYVEAKAQLDNALELASSREKDIASMRTELEEMSKKMDNVEEAAQEEYEVQIKELEDVIEELESSKNELVAMLASKEETLQELEENHEKLRNHLAEKESIFEENEVLKREIQNATEEKQEALSKLEEMTSSMENMSNLAETNSQYKENLRILEEKLKESQMIHDKYVEHTERRVQELNEKLYASNEQMSSLEKDALEAAHTAEEAIVQKENVSQELQVLVEQMEGLLAVKNSLEAENASLKQQLNTISQDEGPKEELQRAREEVDSLRTKCQDQENEISRLRSFEETYEKQIEEIEARCDAAELRYKSNESLLQKSRQEALSFQENCKILESQIAALRSESRSEESGKLGQEISSLRTELSSIQAKYDYLLLEKEGLEKRIQSLGASKQSMQEMEGEIQRLKQDLESSHNQLEAEKRRSSQLDEFVTRQQKAMTSSQTGNKKNEDDDEDMEAAALAGGTAFKPLVGLVRSLPAPLSNVPLTNAARQLDKAAVALDARPHLRVVLLLYLMLLHVMVLV